MTKAMFGTGTGAMSRFRASRPAGIGLGQAQRSTQAVTVRPVSGAGTQAGLVTERSAEPRLFATLQFHQPAKDSLALSTNRLKDSAASLRDLNHRNRLARCRCCLNRNSFFIRDSDRRKCDNSKSAEGMFQPHSGTFLERGDLSLDRSGQDQSLLY